MTDKSLLRGHRVQQQNGARQTERQKCVCVCEREKEKERERVKSSQKTYIRKRIKQGGV